MAAEEYAKTDDAARARYYELKSALDQSHGAPA
jgi:hypothetical protein